MRWRLALLAVCGFFFTGVASGLDLYRTSQLLQERVDRVASGLPSRPAIPGPCLAVDLHRSPGLAVRHSALLASWQNVAGCGASAATGGAAGVKWVGRSVTGGLFGVQCQATYSPLMSDPNKVEHHLVLNTLITRAISDRWSVGINIPLVYKYLRDPYQLDIDLSNGGLGDASLQVTRQLGPIGATSLTANIGLPTGKADTSYRMSPLRQHQQLGFGKPTASVTLDQTLDQVWGLVVLGGVASYRGGQNKLENYRAATGSAYTFTGFYLGPFVPTVGVSTTFFTGYDRDRSEEENSALFAMAGTVSVEWSTDWIALLVGASLPYQYDAVFKTSEGFPKSPWRWGEMVLGLGVTLSPF